ncbi:MAG: hypothetical protein AB2392_22555 [Neobacillus sp.]
MNTEKLENALKSIGKKSFVEEYEVYSKHNMSSKLKINLLSEKYSKNGATIRVSFAEEIIKNKKQKEALEIIINSPRITYEVKEKAKTILRDLDN